MNLAQFVFVGLLCTTPFVRESSAAVTYLGSPTFSQNLVNAPTIDFEGYPDGTVANSLFQNQGITFSRDDGNSITIVSGMFRSNNNLLWTGSSPPTEGSLEIQSSIPLYEIGAYITGIGVTDPGDRFLSMTVFDVSGNIVGSVSAHFGFPTSGFLSFEGLQSSIPFSRVRFDSPPEIGTTAADQFYLDNLRFSSIPIPEPRSLTLGCLGFSLMVVLSQSKGFRLKYGLRTTWRRNGSETGRND